jgi:hypothetical protein
VLRLGSAILASVLLGVPRALDGRAFGVTRSVYIDVAPGSPELAAFATELFRALGEAELTAATRPAGETLVVEIHALWRAESESGPVSEVVCFTALDPGGARPFVLQYAPEARSAAARALLRSLEPVASA